MPGWRNWQTRGTQNPFPFGECGFKSRPGHDHPAPLGGVQAMQASGLTPLRSGAFRPRRPWARERLGWPRAVGSGRLLVVGGVWDAGCRCRSCLGVSAGGDEAAPHVGSGWEAGPHPLVLRLASPDAALMIAAARLQALSAYRTRRAQLLRHRFTTPPRARAFPERFEEQVVLATTDRVVHPLAVLYRAEDGFRQEPCG